jgi:hypothetical protein
MFEPYALARASRFLSVAWGTVEHMFDPIPSGLDDLEPGPMLAGYLASIDVSRVSGFDRVVVLRAEQRMAAHYAARSLASMVSVVAVMDEDDPVVAAECAAAEIRASETELHDERIGIDPLPSSRCPLEVEMG